MEKKKKGVHPNSLKNLKKFGIDKGKDPNAGRKKKIYTILKEKGYGSQDIKTAFKEMAWYTLSELKEVYSDDSKPVITRIVANQFHKAYLKGDWSRIKEIMEYTIGRPVETTKLQVEKSDNVTISYEDMNEETNED